MRKCSIYSRGNLAVSRAMGDDFPVELEVHPDLGHDYPLDFQKSLTCALAFILQD